MWRHRGLVRLQEACACGRWRGPTAEDQSRCDRAVSQLSSHRASQTTPPRQRIAHSAAAATSSRVLRKARLSPFRRARAAGRSSSTDSRAAAAPPPHATSAMAAASPPRSERALKEVSENAPQELKPDRDDAKRLGPDAAPSSTKKRGPEQPTEKVWLGVRLHVIDATSISVFPHRRPRRRRSPRRSRTRS